MTWSSPYSAKEQSDARADYLAGSPGFDTQSKPDCAQALGLDGVRAVAASGHPTAGIGGIHQENTADVIAAGACGIAVISALRDAPNPTQAAQRLRAIFAQETV